MKILLRCIKCLAVAKDQAGDSQAQYPVETNHDGLYLFECSHGHKYAYSLQNHIFEMLFNQGAIAYLDGYPREAVFNFFSARERFHEYCIALMLELQDITTEEFTKTWTLIKNQSERQAGAFYFLYLSLTKEAPPAFFKNGKIDGKTSDEYRNSIVHKGSFPIEDVYKCGDELFEYMKAVINKLRSIYGKNLFKGITLADQKFFENQRKQHGKDIQKAGGLCPTIFSIALGEEAFNTSTFSKELDWLKQNGHKFYTK